ncbi:MAG TPA: UDP-N-acetylmuramate dehydrogenase [Phototrophicaceae bacterium]|nr:UDP-N-acetylmuramate dehydrogenase [Phototrophicaceae bacterium]
MLADFQLLRNESLAKYTAARLGGPADFLYVARDSNEHLSEVVRAAWREGIPVRVLGGGANVLISDAGFRGLVVINRVSKAAFHEATGTVANTVTVTAGTSLTILARKCASKGLAGFEWAVSVPGTVGGAVVNNAGAHGGDMASCLRSAVLVDAEHGTQMLTNADLAYAYRSSSLKGRPDRRFLVMMATLNLTSDHPAAINARMEEFITHRKRTQPPGASLGSIFKNPPGDYAGRLIEVCGLKGAQIGAAQVSPIHANFFINTGDATATDYFRLIERVREAVHEQTGVLLETEVECIGEGFMS